MRFQKLHSLKTLGKVKALFKVIKYRNLCVKIIENHDTDKNEVFKNFKWSQFLATGFNFKAFQNQKSQGTKNLRNL